MVLWCCYPFSQTFLDIVSLADVGIHLANVGHNVSVTSDENSIRETPQTEEERQEGPADTTYNIAMNTNYQQQ